jgi:anaerobic selenocysteine-containing dehydrogenase
MADRIVRGACPHDCPDTCAMQVTVDESGRATGVTGDPEHPITAGFLCGKVSNYIDRVYAEDRLLKPLMRTGEKGAGEFREASWEEAVEAAGAGIEDAIERHGGESVLPYSYMGTMGALQAGSMANRFMNAIGATNLVRTICAEAGIVGTISTQGVSPEVDPEEWSHARYLLVWGWNPMSTSPHLWRKLIDARKAGAKLVVVDPYRSRTANVADEHLRPLPGTDAALGLGMMRAIADAGLVDDEWCRAHATGFDEVLERIGERDVEHWARICDVPAADIERIAREFAQTQPALLRLGVGAQRHLGAPTAYRTISCLPALVGAWRHRGGGCSYIPTATAGAVSSSVLDREDLRPGPVRSLNMSQLGDALTDPGLEPPVSALVVWSSNPAQVAPEQEKVLEGLRRQDLHTVVIEQFMTDTAAHADVVLPCTTQLEHLDAIFSWGHHYYTLNEPAIEPLGEAKTTTEAFRLLAARLGLDAPCFSESDEEMLASMLADEPAGVSLEGLRERGWQKIDLGQGPTPHAEGGFGTADGKLQLRAAALAEQDLDPLPFFDEPAEVTDGELAERFPLALVTPKTHLFLNSTFANQKRQHSAQPEPFVVLSPADAEARGIENEAFVRVFNDRGSFECRVHVSDDTRAGVLVAPMGWWSGDYRNGIGAQATTPQTLTRFGEAPTFNDNRVELSAL